MDIKNLNAKDKMIIANAIAKTADTIYKDSNTFVFNYLITKDINYKSDLGIFYTSKNTTETTVEETIAKKQEAIEKLQNEVKELQKLDKSSIYVEDSYKLNCKPSKEAYDIATKLLQDLLQNINSKTLNNKLEKLMK